MKGGDEVEMEGAGEKGGDEVEMEGGEGRR